MKKTKKQKQIFSSIIYFILYLVIISAVLWSAYTIIQLTLEANRRNRAFDELHEKVRMQVAITEELVNREYAQLHIIESILTSQNEIDLSELNAVWEMMSEREELTMFGFADMSGDVINCNGEKTGNIVNRESFLDIVQGRATEKCVVLKPTYNLTKKDLLDSTTKVYTAVYAEAIDINYHDYDGNILYTAKTTKEEQRGFVEKNASGQEIPIDVEAFTLIIEKAHQLGENRKTNIRFVEWRLQETKSDGTYVYQNWKDFKDKKIRNR